jgi:hypothetical protein
MVFLSVRRGRKFLLMHMLNDPLHKIPCWPSSYCDGVIRNALCKYVRTAGMWHLTRQGRGKEGSTCA